MLETQIHASIYVTTPTDTRSFNIVNDQEECLFWINFKDMKHFKCHVLLVIKSRVMIYFCVFTFYFVISSR